MKKINIKNPIILIGSKAKKVIVDNINMTIDVWTKEVPSEESLVFYIESFGTPDLYTFDLPMNNITFNDLLLNYGTYDSSHGGGYKYYGQGSYFLYALVKSSTQLYDLHFGKDPTPYGSSISIPLNTIITDKSAYSVTISGSGSND